MRIIMHAIGASEALVGIEDNKPEAIAAMRGAGAFPRSRSVPVPARYPMGSDKQLIQTLTGKEVPADARAAEVGVLVHNVSTCAAVHRAIRLGEPLGRTHRHGQRRRRLAPGNIFAPLGTLVVRPAGLRRPARRAGAPDPGRADDGQPCCRTAMCRIVKGSLRHPRASMRARRGCPTPAPASAAAVAPSVCPMGLLPLEMAAHIRAGDLDGAVRFKLSDCIACGCCAYVCPSHIPLVQYFSHAKGELSTRERTRLRNESSKRLAEQRVVRLSAKPRKKPPPPPSARPNAKRSQGQGRG
jgi:electron transport complex protein RnfC